MIYDKYVPSEGEPSAKLWCIGESPGYDETVKSRPFIGESGDLLRRVLTERCGLKTNDNGVFDDVFITNLCHYRPKDNKFSYLVNSPQLKDGLDEIKSLLQEHSPNCILLLGAEPLWYLSGKRGIFNYRGSIIPSNLFEDDKRRIKCVASLHPSYILRQRKAYPLFDFDVRRAVEEMEHKKFNYPKLDIKFWENDLELFTHVANQPELDVDIETTRKTVQIRCISFTYDDYKALVFPWNGDNIFWIQSLLAGSAKKTFHNGVFDVGVLKLNGITVENYTDDTLLMAHVLEPQLPKSLAILTSTCTRMPYYKHEGKSEKGDADNKGWGKKASLERLMTYCGKDTIATRAVRQELIADLKQRGLYSFYSDYEMKLQYVALDLCHKGLLVDEGRRELMREACKKQYKKYYNILWSLNNNKDINPGSPKQVSNLLYKTLGLPVRRHPKTKKPTTDENALVSLMSHCETEMIKLKTDNAKLKWKLKLATIKTLLQLRYWMKLYSAYIDIQLHDGRAKSTWKVAGTETGRPSAGLFYDESGLALTTIPRSDVEVA